MLIMLFYDEAFKILDGRILLLDIFIECRATANEFKIIWHCSPPSVSSSPPPPDRMIRRAVIHQLPVIPWRWHPMQPSAVVHDPLKSFGDLILIVDHPHVEYVLVQRRCGHG